MTYHAKTFEQVTALASPIILFAAMLLFGIFASPQYAYAWIEVLSQGTMATTPMAIDGVVAILSALVTAVSVVWLYFMRLAR
jgi:hypothetical protein